MLRNFKWLVLCAMVTLTSCATGTKGLQFEELDWQADYFTPSARVYFDTGSDEDDEVDVYKDGALTAAIDFVGISKPFLIKKATPVADAELELERARIERTRVEGTGERAVRDADDEVKRSERQLDEARVVERSADRKRNQGTRLEGDWVFGVRGAVGMTSPAEDSEDGSQESSGAPVVFVSGSLYLDLYKAGKTVSDDEGVGVRLEVGMMYGMSADESLRNADDTAVFVGMTAFL